VVTVDDIPVSLRDPAHARGYRSLPIPDRIDEDVAALLSTIGDDSRAFGAYVALVEQLGLADTLLGFAERMASLGVRRGNLTHVWLGLVGVAVCMSVPVDYREALPVMALLYRSLERLDVVPGPEFVDVARLGSEDVQRFVRTFLSRSDLPEIVERMWYTEGSDSDGFRFIYSGS
jgi:hypothetical protein